MPEVRCRRILFITCHRHTQFFIIIIYSFIEFTHTKSYNMSVKSVIVDSKEALQFSTTTYLAKGFVVANSTPEKVVMQKKKEFKALWAIMGFFFCVVPLVIYIIYYVIQPEVEIVEISIMQR